MIDIRKYSKRRTTPREDGSVSVKVTDTIIVSEKVTDTGGASASRVSAQNTAYKRFESHVHGMLPRLCS